VVPGGQIAAYVLGVVAAVQTVALVVLLVPRRPRRLGDLNGFNGAHRLYAVVPWSVEPAPATRLCNRARMSSGVYESRRR
jgi:hypothetical protein